MKSHARILLVVTLGIGGGWLLRSPPSAETNRASVGGARVPRAPVATTTVDADAAHGHSHIDVVAPSPSNWLAMLPPGSDPDIQSPNLLPHSVLTEGLADLPDDTTVAPRQLLVETATAAELVALAERYNVGVVLGRGGAPKGVLLAQDGQDIDALREALRQESTVISVSRNGIVRGAHEYYTTSFRDLQWHLDEADFPETTLRSTRIAVLDTGIAYRNNYGRCWCSNYKATKAASSLSYVTLWDPWDYVSDNAYPDDEHGHGTHIASLIVGHGSIEGGARGAALIPYRVLDENNVGLESDLVDALYWSTAMGAHVINMSLSFGAGYFPSEALVQALEDAHLAGATLVAAAGNAGDYGATWPAASPHVIGVGASCGADGALSLAPYSNRGGDVDILAPGGCLAEDANEDGYPDGLLAESFAEGSPTQIGLYWAQGTSQAAALVSSAVARLRERGMSDDVVLQVLEAGGTWVEDAHFAALDQSSLNYAGSAEYLLAPPAAASGYYVAMLPWISQDEDQYSPRLHLLVLDDAMAPVDNVVVRGHFKGSSNAAFRCVTEDGRCAVEGASVVAPEGDVGWTVTIGRAGEGLQGKSPRGVMLLSPELDQLVGDWSAAYGDVPPIGFALTAADLDGAAHAWSFVATGSGISTSPFGIVLSDPLLVQMGATMDSTAGGSGISTSPFGFVSIDLTGDALPDLLAINGSGISTSPFGVLVDAYTTGTACMGTTGCTTSVYSPTDGTVSGSLGGSSAAAQVLGSSSETELLWGASAWVTGDAGGATMTALSDEFVLFLAE